MVIKMGETSKMLVKFPSITDQAAWNEFVNEARKFYADATPLGYLKDMDYKTWLDNTIRLNIGSPLNDGEIPISYLKEAKKDSKLNIKGPSDLLPFYKRFVENIPETYFDYEENVIRNTEVPKEIVLSELFIK